MNIRNNAKTKSLIKCMVVLLGAFGAASNVWAASITWIAQGTFNDNTFLTNSGPVSNMVYGVDFAGAGAVMSANGYTFNNYLTTGNFSIAGSPASYTGWLNSQTSGDAGLDAILNNANYGTISANPGTLHSLTAGQTYAVLVFLDDNRGSSAGGSNFRVNDGTANSPAQLYGTYASGTPGNPLGGYLLGTFTADATTQTLTVQNDNQAGSFSTGNAQYSGILLVKGTPPVVPFPVLITNIQPASASVGVGGQAAFSAAFADSPPVILQWQFIAGGVTNNVSASNARTVTVTNDGVVSSTLTFTNLQMTNAGSYLLKAVNATNSLGVVYTASAKLTVSSLIFWIQTGAFTNGSLDSVLALAGAVSNEVYGVDFGGSGAQTTSSGYSFDDGFTSGNMSIDTNVSPAGLYNNYLRDGGDAGDIAIDILLTYGLYGSSLNMGTLHNLTVGQTYNVLAILADTRVGSDAQAPGTKFYGTDGVYPGRGQAFVFPQGTNALGGYVMGTFTAQSTNQPFSLITQTTGGNYGNCQYSAIVLMKASPLLYPPIYLASDIQPGSVTAAQGGQIAFTAGFANNMALNFQWQVVTNGMTNNISAGVANVTNDFGVVYSTLTLSNLQLTDAGSYQIKAVNATNSLDFVYSSAASLTVVPTINWVASGTFTDNSVLAMLGAASNEVYGVDFGGSGLQTTANGYTFDDYATSGNMSIAGSPGSYDLYMGGVAVAAGTVTTGDTNFDNVLTHGIYGGTDNSGTLNNLTVGQNYTVLALLDDTRGGSAGGLYFRTTEGVTFSLGEEYAFADGSPSVGGYILGTFTADAAMKSFSIQTSADGSNYSASQYNAIIVAKTSAVPPKAPTLAAPYVSGGNLILAGNGGTANAQYTWLSTTNLSAPITWVTNTTGTLDGSGVFSNAIPVSTATPETFFRMRLP